MRRIAVCRYIVADDANCSWRRPADDVILLGVKIPRWIYIELKYTPNQSAVFFLSHNKQNHRTCTVTSNLDTKVLRTILILFSIFINIEQLIFATKLLLIFVLLLNEIYSFLFIFLSLDPINKLRVTNLHSLHQDSKSKLLSHADDWIFSITFATSSQVKNLLIIFVMSGKWVLV